MRVYRGRAGSPEADRAATERLVDAVAESEEPALRVWTPHQQVAFGRRDANAEGYDRAKTVALEHGYAVTERAVGGHAVVFTGTTVAFARAVPIDDPRSGIQDRYEHALETLTSALGNLDIAVSQDEPDGAFCPGTHSLSAGGKIVGIAQRVSRQVATVAGIVIVDDEEAIAGVLEPIYEALGVPFDPKSVGSIASAGGNASPETVIGTIEERFAGDDPPVEQVVERVQDSPRDSRTVRDT